VKVRLSGLAEKDVTQILRETRRMFGARQLGTYATLIDGAAQMIAEDPNRPSSLDRTELGPDVRSVHLELAAGRPGGASHMVYYTEGNLPDGSRGLSILRVLHESMEPKNRVARSLDWDKRRDNPCKQPGAGIAINANSQLR
jgi:toxin ParE1/3/4